MKSNLFKRGCLFFITAFSLLSVVAQDNHGVRGTSVSTISKTVSSVAAMQEKFSITRRPKEKFEGNYRPHKQANPAAPAVSSFGVSSSRPATPAGITATQTIHSNFLATSIGDGLGFSPPDCIGDLSTANQLMIAVNGRLKVFNVPTVTEAAAVTTQSSSNISLSNPVLNLDIDAFFSNSSLGLKDFSDPHVRFDRLSGRWFLCIIDITNPVKNYLVIAVSNSTVLTPTSTFSIYYLQSATGNPANNNFFDYPTLGVDANALYIGGNTFDTAGPAFRGSPIYIVNKASLLSGGPAVFSAFQYGIGSGKTGSTPATGIYTPQGVHNDDPAATEGYLIGTDNAAFSNLIIKRVINPGGTPSLSADINLTVPTTEFPQSQPASGSTGGLDATDDRLFAAMLMKNKITGITSLWTAHNIEVSISGVASATGNRNGSRWYEIRNLITTPTLQQSGTLFNNVVSSPRGFWMPSIAMSGQGHALLGSSVAASNRKVQVAIAGRYANDAAGTLQPYDSVTKTTSSYGTTGGKDRWGDFSQTIVDPKDNMTMWTFQEYCNSLNSWGLRAIQIKAPAPASNPVATATANNFCGSNIAVTITGTTTANEGFFDPGADAGGPGFSRLAVSCSGGIPVSDVTFVSPAVVTCQINTNGFAGGTYTFTITNPDGQIVTTTFNLPSNCTLPVTLIDFNGRFINNEIQLNWKTTAEYNFKGFEIEKGFEGSNFSYLTKVAAKGNSSTENIYTTTDAKPYPNYSYYRLKIIDRDGGFKYSDIVKIKTPPKSIAITKIFPNPAKDNLTIELITDKKQTVKIEVFDMAGKRVSDFNLVAEQGINTKQVSLNRLANGTYYIQAKDTNGNIIEKTKIVKN